MNRYNTAAERIKTSRIQGPRTVERRRRGIKAISFELLVVTLERVSWNVGRGLVDIRRIEIRGPNNISSMTTLVCKVRQMFT